MMFSSDVQCAERDLLIRLHSDLTDQMNSAVSLLNQVNEKTISPIWGKRLVACDRLTEEVVKARIALETHRKEHGC